MGIGIKLTFQRGPIFGQEGNAVLEGGALLVGAGTEIGQGQARLLAQQLQVAASRGP